MGIQSFLKDIFAPSTEVVVFAFWLAGPSVYSFLHWKPIPMNVENRYEKKSEYRHRNIPAGIDRDQTDNHSGEDILGDFPDPWGTLLEETKQHISQREDYTNNGNFEP